MATGGTYTLVVELPDTAQVTVGALGETTFEGGWYAYVGSALGSGGFARIDRHRELAAGERDTRHWHIDYLLGHPDSRLADVVRTAGLDGECRIAGRIGCDSVASFGCSDCGCESHLFFDADRKVLVDAVRGAHERVREDSVSTDTDRWT